MLPFARCCGAFFFWTALHRWTVHYEVQVFVWKALDSGTQEVAASNGLADSCDDIINRHIGEQGQCSPYSIVAYDLLHGCVLGAAIRA